MNAVSYFLYFLAGMATLLIGIPQFALENKLNRSKVPDVVYGLSRPVLIALNILALVPGIIVLAEHGIFSLPTLLVLMGIVFGAIPVLAFLMAPMQNS